MAWLDRLCLQDGDGHEQRAKLFEWVFEIVHNLPSHSSSTSTLKLIRDAGIVLRDRINTEDYEESQDDVRAASGITEDIRDALLEYQVRIDEPYTTEVRLKSRHLDR